MARAKGKKLIGKAAKRLWLFAIRYSHPEGYGDGGFSQANDNESPWTNDIYARTQRTPPRKKPIGRRHDVW